MFKEKDPPATESWLAEMGGMTGAVEGEGLAPRTGEQGLGGGDFDVVDGAVLVWRRGRGGMEVLRMHRIE